MLSSMYTSLSCDFCLNYLKGSVQQELYLNRPLLQRHPSSVLRAKPEALKFGGARGGRLFSRHSAPSLRVVLSTQVPSTNLWCTLDGGFPNFSLSQLLLYLHKIKEPICTAEVRGFMQGKVSSYHTKLFAEQLGKPPTTCTASR